MNDNEKGIAYKIIQLDSEKRLHLFLFLSIIQISIDL